jgi:lactate dehydrogenase-like 2-hydroxyacid dehydrogenase
MDRPTVAVMETLPGVRFDAMADAVNLVRLRRLADAPASQAQAVVTTAGDGFTAALAEAMPHLSLVASLGAGLDRVEPLPARVRVVAVGEYLTDDVADLAMALLVMANRRLVAADAFVRTGAWRAGPFALGRGLTGRTLGIVGYGRVGGAIARRAQAAGMRVLVHTRTPRADIAWAETPETLARAADALVLCCPGGEATRGIVGARELAALGPEGVLINVARGSVIDEAALAEGLERGLIAGAALDVFQDEPAPNPRLLAAPNLTLTPHIGGATWDARGRAGLAAAAAVLRHFGLA